MTLDNSRFLFLNLFLLLICYCFCDDNSIFCYLTSDYRFFYNFRHNNLLYNWWSYNLWLNIFYIFLLYCRCWNSFNNFHFWFRDFLLYFYLLHHKTWSGSLKFWFFNITCSYHGLKRPNIFLTQHSRYI